MEIRPGISTSLYVSMILFVAAFSGQNSSSSQASKPADISINSITDSVVKKNKPSGHFRDSSLRIKEADTVRSLNAHGTE